MVAAEGSEDGLGRRAGLVVVAGFVDGDGCPVNK